MKTHQGIEGNWNRSRRIGADGSCGRRGERKDEEGNRTRYIYTDSVALGSLNEAMNVYKAAHKYMIPGLMKLCIDSIWDFLSPKTACTIYEFAKDYEDTELEEMCLKIISIDTVEVMEDPSFLEIKCSTLERILDMDDLSVPSELTCFKALVNWGECQRKAADIPVTLRSVVSTTLPKVRFLTLDPKEIAGEIDDSVLLTESEKYAILKKAVNKCKNVPFPVNISTNETVRRSYKPSENENKYPWIKIVSTNTTHGEKSITNISFQVAKKTKIMGVEVNSNWKNTLRTNCQRGTYVKPITIMVLELKTDGRPASASFFHDIEKYHKYVVMDGLNYLLRNSIHTLTITVLESHLHINGNSDYRYYGYSDKIVTCRSLVENQEMSSEFLNEKSKFNLKNLHIESIIYI